MGMALEDESSLFDKMSNEEDEEEDFLVGKGAPSPEQDEEESLLIPDTQPSNFDLSGNEETPVKGGDFIAETPESEQNARCNQMEKSDLLDLKLNLTSPEKTKARLDLDGDPEEENIQSTLPLGAPSPCKVNKSGYGAQEAVGVPIDLDQSEDDGLFAQTAEPYQYDDFTNSPKKGLHEISPAKDDQLNANLDISSPNNLSGSLSFEDRASPIKSPEPAAVGGDTLPVEEIAETQPYFDSDIKGSDYAKAPSRREWAEAMQEKEEAEEVYHGPDKRTNDRLVQLTDSQASAETQPYFNGTSLLKGNEVRETKLGEGPGKVLNGSASPSPHSNGHIQTEVARSKDTASVSPEMAPDSRAFVLTDARLVAGTQPFFNEILQLKKQNNAEMNRCEDRKWKIPAAQPPREDSSPGRGDQVSNSPAGKASVTPENLNVTFSSKSETADGFLFTNSQAHAETQPYFYGFPLRKQIEQVGAAPEENGDKLEGKEPECDQSNSRTVPVENRTGTCQGEQTKADAITDKKFTVKTAEQITLEALEKKKNLLIAQDSPISQSKLKEVSEDPYSFDDLSFKMEDAVLPAPLLKSVSRKQNAQAETEKRFQGKNFFYSGDQKAGAKKTPSRKPMKPTLPTPNRISPTKPSPYKSTRAAKATMKLESKSPVKRGNFGALESAGNQVSGKVGRKLVEDSPAKIESPVTKQPSTVKRTAEKTAEVDESPVKQSKMVLSSQDLSEFVNQLNSADSPAPNDDSRAQTKGGLDIKTKETGDLVKNDTPVPLRMETSSAYPLETPFSAILEALGCKKSAKNAKKWGKNKPTTVPILPEISSKKQVKAVREVEKLTEGSSMSISDTPSVRKSARNVKKEELSNKLGDSASIGKPGKRSRNSVPTVVKLEEAGSVESWTELDCPGSATRRSSRKKVPSQKMIESLASSAEISESTRKAGKTPKIVKKEEGADEPSEIERRSIRKRKDVKKEATEEPKTLLTVKKERSSSKKSLSTPSTVRKTPRKRQYIDESDSSCSQGSQRALKTMLRVVFCRSGVGTTEPYKKIVKDLGGTVLEQCNETNSNFMETMKKATHIVTGKFDRTTKILCGIGLRKPLVSYEWLDGCMHAGKVVEYENFLLCDKAAEQKWKFKLKSLMVKSQKETPIFLDQSFYLTKNLDKPNKTALSYIIRCNGGEILVRAPSLNVNDRRRTWIVSCDEDLNEKAVKQASFSVVKSSFVLDGIMQWKLGPLESHLLIK